VTRTLDQGSQGIDAPDQVADLTEIFITDIRPLADAVTPRRKAHLPLQHSEGNSVYGQGCSGCRQSGAYLSSIVMENRGCIRIQNPADFMNHTSP